VSAMAARISGLRVLESGSAKPGAAPRFARYVLRGSVRPESGRFRVLARLVDAERGYVLWSEGYGCNLEDASSIAARVTAGVAQTLNRAAAPGQPRHSNNTEAVRLYWQARALRRDTAPESLSRSADLLRKALAIDSGYALARVQLADALATMGFHQYDGAPELIRQARAEALKALEQDPGLFEAHGTLAWIQFYGEWDWRGAEASFRKALSLNPSGAKTYATLALLLAAEGRFAEAQAEVRNSLAVDPLNQARSSNMAVVQYLARDCGRVRATARKLLEADPNSAPAYTMLGGCASIENRPRDAVRQMEAALKASAPERFTYLTGRLGFAYAKAGRIDDARRMLAESEATQVHAALVCAGLGDREGALRRLEESERRRETDILFARVEPLFDSLHGEPRFERVMRRVRGF
jgi:tetratricopeptide (TPR) repeat protein